MKILFHTFFLIITCSIISFGQKKYIVKITTLDNRVKNGMFFQVDDKGVFIFPRSSHSYPKLQEANLNNALFIDFRTIKNIKIRRKGRVARGVLIGFFSGVAGVVITGKILSANKSKSVNSLENAIIFFVISSLVLGGAPALGGAIGDSYPYKYSVTSDSTSMQALKTKLKKYEWYHKE